MAQARPPTSHSQAHGPSVRPAGRLPHSASLRAVRPRFRAQLSLQANWSRSRRRGRCNRLEADTSHMQPSTVFHAQ
jgi:hypothetical protein